ncbi:MAG TPA: PadR family transcriptional regulator [Kofleriaceae bacterium]|jgi:DNA-binding PadR family transcriptional regulator
MRLHGHWGSDDERREFGGRGGGRRGGRRGGRGGGAPSFGAWPPPFPGGAPPFAGGPPQPPVPPSPPSPPFFGDAPSGWHGRRARRGEIRAAILGLLGERPMHGYELMRELESRSGGMWRPSPGSVYPTLQMLEDEGLVTGSEVDGRRTFALTESGRGERAERGDEAPPWQEAAGEVGAEVHGLREASLQLGAAVMQLARLGSRERMRQALDILKEARRRIYTLLAEAD